MLRTRVVSRALNANETRRSHCSWKTKTYDVHKKRLSLTAIPNSHSRGIAVRLFLVLILCRAPHSSVCAIYETAGDYVYRFVSAMLVW